MVATNNLKNCAQCKMSQCGQPDATECTMVTWQMNLDDEPFQSIASGNKTIEMRLNDERRRGIQVGHCIVFTNNVTGAKLVAKVLALHKFESFAQLYSTLDLTKCGYTRQQLATAHPDDMLKYYSLERQQQYGVLGIELQLLCVCK